MRRLPAILMCGLFFSLPFACDDDDDDSSTSCTPGESRECFCADGSTSAQACNAIGDGWQVCDCEEVVTDSCARTDTDFLDLLPTVVKGTLTVPDDFDGKPIAMFVSFTDKWVPHGELSYPAGIGATILCVPIGAGLDYELETYGALMMGGTAPLVGEYYMQVLLFVEGGGGDGTIPIPEGGSDYGAMTPVAVNIDPEGDVADFGTLELQVWPVGAVIDMDAGPEDY
jgi:hypothetical protein